MPALWLALGTVRMPLTHPHQLIFYARFGIVLDMSADLMPRPLIWIASSLDDLKEFPSEVRSDMGFALYVAQCGRKHEQAKPLKGFGGAGVLEVVRHFDGNSYRAVYTVRFAERV